MEKRDFYEVLNVSRDASNEEIKKSFRQAAIKYHPDKNPDTDTESLFKEAAEAYEILSDQEKRANYDQFGHAGIKGGPSNYNDIFESFRSGMFNPFGGGRRTQQSGGNLQIGLEVEFLEAALGASKTITFERPEPCLECKGSGAKKGTSPITCTTCKGQGVVQKSHGFFHVQTTCPACQGNGTSIKEFCPPCKGQGKVPHKRECNVNIPAGIGGGMRLRVSGEGEPGSSGNPPGDLFIIIRVKSHPYFDRQDNHILLEIPISFTQAVLGTTINVPTIYGSEKFKVKRGTQPGTVIPLRGKGIASLRNRRRGDQLIRLVVEVPQKLNPKMKELLNELAKLEEADITPQRQVYINKTKYIKK